MIGERERANLVVQTARFFDRVRRVSAHARLRYALLFIRNHFQYFFHKCYVPAQRQDNALLHAAMMARADTVIVCSLPLAKNALLVTVLLTLGAHAQRGLYLVCHSVRLSVCLSVTTFSPEDAYQRVQCHTGFILKIAIKNAAFESYGVKSKSRS